MGASHLARQAARELLMGLGIYLILPLPGVTVSAQAGGAGSPACQRGCNGRGTHRVYPVDGLFPPQSPGPTPQGPRLCDVVVHNAAS